MTVTPANHSPPFGTYGLNAREKWARAQAGKLGTGRKDKLIRSILWRYADGSAHRPRDVDVFTSQKARLHPYDNICEKRVFMTPQLWEAKERQQLENHINTYTDDKFWFVDAGANVGLYSLFARSCALKKGLSFHATAIEPGLKQRERLTFNVEASNANNDITIVTEGLSATGGSFPFIANPQNLGESKLGGQDNRHINTQTIQTLPLLDIVQQRLMPRIDALKIDIEGREHDVLTAFFSTAATSLWPKLIIIEVVHASDDEHLLGMICSHGYQQCDQDRGNAVLIRTK